MQSRLEVIHEVHLEVTLAYLNAVQLQVGLVTNFADCVMRSRKVFRDTEEKKESLNHRSKEMRRNAVIFSSETGASTRSAWHIYFVGRMLDTPPPEHKQLRSEDSMFTSKISKLIVKAAFLVLPLMPTSARATCPALTAQLKKFVEIYVPTGSCTANVFYPDDTLAFNALNGYWFHANGELAYNASNGYWFHSNGELAYNASNGYWFHSNGHLARSPDTGNWFHSNDHIAFLASNRNLFYNDGSLGYLESPSNWFYKSGNLAYLNSSGNWFHSDGSVAYLASVGNWFHFNKHVAFMADSGNWFYPNDQYAYLSSPDHWFDSAGQVLRYVLYEQSYNDRLRFVLEQAGGQADDLRFLIMIQSFAESI